MRNYYPGITLFKLSGAVLVLFAHTAFFRGMTAALPTQQLQFASLVLRVVVPCFYMVSGFLIYQGWVSRERPGAYVRKYVLRIGLVYGLFCLVFAGRFVIPALVTDGLAPGNLLLQAKIMAMAVLLNGPFIQLWFVPPLLFGVLCAYWLWKRGALRVGMWLTLGGYALCQFVSGSLRQVSFADAWRGLLPNPVYAGYVELFVTRYVGFGLTFVLAGVVLAKYETRCLETMRRYFWRVTGGIAIFTALEGWLLYRYAEWSVDYKLAFSVLPCSVLLFYWVLRVRGEAVRRHHRVFNVFSIVTFVCHVPFLELNAALMGQPVDEMTAGLQAVHLGLTFAQCVIVTTLFVVRPRGGKEEAVPLR